ncbi:MAG TPA: fibronectin type III domain-containing protein [Longimicrobium sp.]|nr:fibronectin type III domain-containing protein [Longimicrobium sp.]
MLRSRNNVGVSADSAVISVVPGTPHPTAPRVQADSVTIVRGKLVVWGRVASNLVPGEYGAEWSTAPGMAPVGGSRTAGALTDTMTHAVAVEMGISYEGTYHARLFARNAYGTTYGAVLPVEFVRPAPPQNFDAAARSDGTVEATWTHDGANASLWRLLRRPQGTEAWTVARHNVGPGVRSLTNFTYDVNVDAWEWMVQACNGPLCANTPVDLITGLRLSAPTNLHAVSTEPFNVALEWTAGAGPIVEYVVFRRASVGPVAQWQVPAGTTTFTDTSAQEGVQYHYVVWARNRVGASPLTGEVGVLPGG